MRASKTPFFTPAQRLQLWEWLISHYDQPYPQHQEQERLSQETELPWKTIVTWFGNHRRGLRDEMDSLLETLPIGSFEREWVAVMNAIATHVWASGGAPRITPSMFTPSQHRRSSMPYTELRPAMLRLIATMRGENTGLAPAGTVDLTPRQGQFGDRNATPTGFIDDSDLFSNFSDQMMVNGIREDFYSASRNAQTPIPEYDQSIMGTRTNSAMPFGELGLGSNLGGFTGPRNHTMWEFGSGPVMPTLPALGNFHAQNYMPEGFTATIAPSYSNFGYLGVNQESNLAQMNNAVNQPANGEI